MKCNRHVVKWENSPESSPGRSDASHSRYECSTAWALDDSGTAGIWVCGGWIGRDESQQSTDARETGSHDPDNRAKGESSPMRH